MLTKQAVDEFKGLYLQRYGRVLSEEEATEKAIGLLRLYKAVFLKTINMSMRNKHEKKPQFKANQS